MHYTKIINDDRVPIDFDIFRKEDRKKKCIACYISGFYLKNNLDLWKLHKNGQNVYKTRSKKRYKDYLKGVYIELCKGPDNTGDYLERSNHLLNRVLECMRLENRVCCESCLCVYFSIEETQALNDFCHTFFERVVHLMSGLCMVHVIVWIIFGYYTDKYLDGICIKNGKTDNTTNLDPHYPRSYFCVLFYFIFFLNCNNCVVAEGIKT